MSFIVYFCYITAFGLAGFVFLQALQRRLEVPVVSSTTWGCFAPFVLIILASTLSSYMPEPAVQKADGFKEKMKAIYANVKELSVAELKKLITANYKGLLHRPQEREYLQELLRSVIEDKKLENKKLLKELVVLRKLQMKEKKRQQKMQEVKKRGKVNEKRILEMQSLLEYLDSVFSEG